MTRKPPQKPVRTLLNLPQSMVKELRALAEMNAESGAHGETFRELFDLACEKHLDNLISQLEEFGFGGRGPRRVRAVNEVTWKHLKDAEAKVGLKRPELLRLCLCRLLQDHGLEG